MDADTFRVKLTPKATRNEVGQWIADEHAGSILKVSVTAVPEKGKANKALIALLAKTWKIPKSALEIATGETARLKTLRVASEFLDRVPRNGV
ncbi:MAG: DUF167 domain-containing protein [Alphaproteobacteria bacterium]|nr:DUF167 domain-containing protein [Alphaproteobacteria bacterium]